jgi:hypothetical protein
MVEMSPEQMATLREALGLLHVASERIMSLRDTEPAIEPNVALRLGRIAGEASLLSEKVAGELPDDLGLSELPEAG